MPSHYSDKEKQRVVELYKRGWGYRKLSQVFGCSESTAKKWIEKAGVKKHPKPNHAVQKRRAAIAFYKKNKSASIAHTAKKYKVHPKTVSRWIESEGIRVRERPRKFSRKQILKDIEQGMSGAAIARKHNCSESYVSAIRNGRS